MARFEIAAIRRYYDRHTPSFIRFGQGGRAGAIHRAVSDVHRGRLLRDSAGRRTGRPRVRHGLAHTAGFEHQSTVDLSPALGIRRARDRAINVLGAAADWLPLGTGPLDYLWGGSALQECLARGWIGYDLSVFRRIVS